jgi:Bacterial extracellular solute-binding protein
VEANEASSGTAQGGSRRITRFEALRLMGLGAGVLVGPALMVTGCGPSNELVAIDRIGKENASKSAEVQLNNSYTQQSSTPSWATGFQKLFTKFAKDNPDWKLNLKIIADNQTTQEQARLLEEARAGRAPDWANVDSFVVAQFISQGTLQPLDQYFDKADIEGLYPFVRDIAVGDDGKLYAYWWATDVRVLYRRTDLVPDPPRTWDELIKAAKAAKQKDSKVDGYLFNGGRWEGTVFDNLAHFWSQGRRAGRQQGQAHLRRWEEPHLHAQRFRFPQRVRGQRSLAQVGGHDQGLRRFRGGGPGEVGRHVPGRGLRAPGPRGHPAARGDEEVGGLAASDHEPTRRAEDRFRRLDDGGLHQRRAETEDWAPSSPTTSRWARATRLRVSCRPTRSTSAR